MIRKCAEINHVCERMFLFQFPWLIHLSNKINALCSPVLFYFRWNNTGNLPTVKSSISGRIGIVQPSGFKVAESCPIETRGSTRTVCYKVNNGWGNLIFTIFTKYIKFTILKKIQKCFINLFLCVNLKDIHQVHFDIEQCFLVFGLTKTDSLPTWSSCAHGSLSSLLIPLSYL